MDRLTPEKRSWNMAQIKGKDTAPEILVRSMLHRAGYRFRKNVKTLPGKPDIVLPKYKTVIFVHGCFWHRHKGCKDASTPKTNKAFWKKKFERNVCRAPKGASFGVPKALSQSSGPMIGSTRASSANSAGKSSPCGHVSSRPRKRSVRK